MKKEALLPIKNLLRHELLRRRSEIEPERREGAKNALREHLEILGHGFPTILSFASLENEIDLWLLNESWASQKKLFLPKIDHNDLTIFQVEDLSSLVVSNWNIKEPSNNCPKIPLDQISCILVPGLGFDTANNRIGYGRGYYDRLLKQLTHAVKIGIGFREQFVHSIPIEDHDQKLDTVLFF